ncbi:MAG: xylulokinase [Anaerolineae bacterium]
MSSLAQPLVIGVDVGTNAAKCLVCDRHGNLVAQARRDYALSHPREGWAEQDAEDLWAAVVTTVRQAAAAARDSGRVVALSLSSQGGTTIAVDAQGRPLRPAISWLDTRAGSEGERLAAALGQAAIYGISGWEVGAYLPIVHVPWLAAHEPSTYRRAARYLFVNDFILGRLCGEPVMDPSDASLTVLYNVEKGDWDPTLCAAAGVRTDQLSPIRESGTTVGRLLPEVATATGLPADTLVINGAHDQYCAALGAGVISPGDVLLSCGTAWVLLSVAPHLVRDPGRTFAPGRHAIPGRWGVICSMSAAGASMDWLVHNVIGSSTEERPRYDLLDEHLGGAEAGARGLLFLPYLTGIEVASRATGVWGSLTGLTLAHSRWDIALALMEGVALELRWILERLAALGAPAGLLHMVGGATRSTVWPSVVADVTGLPLSLPPVAEGAARGAAMLAAVGGGMFGSIEEAATTWKPIGRELLPRPARADTYDRLYERFRAVDSALRSAAQP